MNLAAQAGVGIASDPGALQRVNASERFVDLVQRQTSVKQVLERICGNTGLRWEATDQGLHIMAPATAAAGASNSLSGRIVAIVEWEKDGMKVQFPFREDEVSDELKKVRAD